MKTEKCEFDRVKKQSNAEEFRKLVSSSREKIGCSYCGSASFHAVRLQSTGVQNIVECVNLCGECGLDDWCAVSARDLAVVATIISIGM